MDQATKIALVRLGFLTERGELDTYPDMEMLYSDIRLVWRHFNTVSLPNKAEAAPSLLEETQVIIDAVLRLYHDFKITADEANSITAPIVQLGNARASAQAAADRALGLAMACQDYRRELPGAVLAALEKWERGE